MCVYWSCVAERRYTWISPSKLIYPSCLGLAPIKTQVLKSMVAQHTCAFYVDLLTIWIHYIQCTLPPFSYIIIQCIANCYNPAKCYIKLYSLKNFDTAT